MLGLYRTNRLGGRGQLAVRTPGILVGCPNIGNKGGKRRVRTGGREGARGESEEAEIRGSWMKKKSSFRENALWSVKLQPMVLHIVPEALPKKKKNPPM